ncbi:Transcription activator of gluconeogenesis-like protein 2 [Elsinoe fawcettii]|nr:Transcription activator of gluconeogenesis-like protein 2 [Elsinoe fawcettii]
MSSINGADEGPKAKRHRTKYASKACLECQRSKIKCADIRPCPRCVNRGVECHGELPESPPVSRNENIVSRGGDHDLGTRVEDLEHKYQRLETILARHGLSDEDSESVRDGDDYTDRETLSFQGESALMPTITSLEANLQLSPESRQIPGRSEPPTPRASHSNRPTTTNNEKTDLLGAGNLPFPSKATYDSHVQFFFEDVNPCHPCVNEADFHHRARRLKLGSPVLPKEVCFLALNYIIFACVDFLRASDAEVPGQHFPGWKWYLAADRLVGKKKTSGHGDLCLIQYLVYEELLPNEELPPPNPGSSSIPYLLCVCKFAHFAGEIFDKVFSDPQSRDDDLALLDFYINRWLEHELELIMPTRGAERSAMSVRQEVLIRTRMQHLRLLLWRRKMVNLSFDPATGRLCGDVAVDMLEKLGSLSAEIHEPSSFRYYQTAAVGEAVLVLAALLCSTSSTNLGDRWATYIQSLRDGRAILSSLASKLITARRMADRLSAILGLVDTLLSSDMNQPISAEIQNGMHELFEPTTTQGQLQLGLGFPGNANGTFDDFAFDGNFMPFESDVADPFSQVYNIDFM